MKSIISISALCLVLLFTTCADRETPDDNKPIHQHEGLVGLSMLLYKNSQPGLTGYLESIDEVTAKGINLFGMAPEWPELEPSPNTFSFQDPLINPLTLIDPDKTKFKSYILVVKMIDTRRKTVPADLSTLSFDDPQLISRFKNLVDTLAKLPAINRISYLLLGNEVDGYLTEHPAELSSFAFYQQSVDYIHAKLPGVKAGTIVTFNSLTCNSNVMNALLPHSDFICYTYYPTDLTSSRWQMRPPTDVAADISFMAKKAGDKPFAFSEIGYPSSQRNHSSEALQKDFVENMFAGLKPYRANKQLEFIFYHGLYDYPDGACVQYAQS